MQKYVLPVFGCVAVMTMFADSALARERSHHRQASKHSHHHSWRAHASSRHSYRGQRWRGSRRVVVATPPDAAVEPFGASVAYQWPVRQVTRRAARRAALRQPSAYAVAPQWGIAQPVAQPVAPGWAVAPPVAAPAALRQPRAVAVERHRAPDQFASLVSSHARAHGLPESLVHRVIMRESRYNPRAVSRGNYGIMQIRLGTARAMGYTGSAAGLLDPNTNMTYAVRYLAGAYRAAGGNPHRAVSLYARGYYHQAKRSGFSPYAAGARSRAAAVAIPVGAASPARNVF